MGAVKGSKKMFGGAVGWVKGKYEKGKKWVKDKYQAAKDRVTGKGADDKQDKQDGGPEASDEVKTSRARRS